MESLLNLYFKRYQNLILFLAVIVAGFLCGYKSLYMILLLLLSMLVFLCFYKTEAVFIILFSAVFIIPSAEKFNEFFRLTMPIIHIYYATLALIVLTGVAVVKAIVRKGSISNLSRYGSYFVLMALTLAYVLLGIMRGNPYLRPDTELYVFFLMYILAAVIIRDNKAIDKLAKILVVISALLSCFVIAIYALRGSFLFELLTNSFGEESSRFGTGSQTTFSIIMPLIYTSIKYKLYDGKWAIAGYISLFLMAASVIISESRALFLSIAFNFMVVYLWFWIRSDHEKFIKKLLSVVLSVTILALILVSANYLLEGNEKVESFKNRVTEMQNIGKVGSYGTRQMTNKINYMKIRSKPGGYGVGEPIGLYNAFGELETYGTFVDNAVITVMYKMGYPGIIVFALFYLKRVYNVMMVAWLDKDKRVSLAATVVLLCIPMYFVNSVYFTAQVISSYAVNSFTMVVFALIDNRLYEIKMLKQDGAINV